MDLENCRVVLVQKLTRIVVPRLDELDTSRLIDNGLGQQRYQSVLGQWVLKQKYLLLLPGGRELPSDASEPNSNCQCVHGYPRNIASDVGSPS